MRSSSLGYCLIALLTSDVAFAFTSHRGGNAVGQNYSILCAISSRSDFLKTSIASIASVATFSPTKTLAEGTLDDLSMPSASEQKTADVSG
jgi:hypothetical protein